jgi:hypothetical protein
MKELQSFDFFGKPLVWWATAFDGIWKNILGEAFDCLYEIKLIKDIQYSREESFAVSELDGKLTTHKNKRKAMLGMPY